MKSKGLIYKINRAFLLQAALITIAALLGVFFAKIVIEQTLIRNAISQEEDYFWSNYTLNDQFPLPDTKNMTGFFNPNLLPSVIDKKFPNNDGFQEYGEGDERVVLHISSQNNKTLYLVYYHGQVDSLILYYGMFPLFTVLLILYLSLWMAYRFNRRTVSPVIQLASQINEIDFSNPDFSLLSKQKFKFDNDDEVSLLSDAMVHLGERLTEFVSRERNFTRDASHELRSPLTVINLAADMLMSEQELSKPAYKSVIRIKRAIADMEKLTEIFLLLAREDEQALSKELVVVNEILEEEIQLAKILKGQKDIQFNFNQNSIIELKASDLVLSVIFGNVIRNAIKHSQSGTINITVLDQQVVISDEGEGMKSSDLESVFQPFFRGENVNASGFGIGLTIVKRLTDRFNWTVDVESQEGKGTQFVIVFS